MTSAVKPGDKNYGLPRNLRLIQTEAFGVIAKTKNERSFFIRSRFFSAAGIFRSSEGVPLRFGFTVGKKNAPRSVDRALIKRILREAARHQAPSLLVDLKQQDLGLDVSLRFSKPLSSINHAEGVTALKRQLHADVKELMPKLLNIVRRYSAIASKNSDANA